MGRSLKNQSSFKSVTLNLSDSSPNQILHYFFSEKGCKGLLGLIKQAIVQKNIHY
jgi:hypothetical protein